MACLGNHVKVNAPARLRVRISKFYTDALGCRAMASPLENLDLFLFENDCVIGVFFVDERAALLEEEFLKGAWLELKTPDVEELKQKVLNAGAKPVDWPDPARFYFQAPGGQVFRIAPLNGDT
jgi:hypothetical protein